MVDVPLYYYLQNPASVTRNYLPDYMDTFRKFYANKSALAARYGLDDDDPEWRESTCWAGLLIAIGNEFAAGNPATMQEKKRRVAAYALESEMAEAIRIIDGRAETECSGNMTKENIATITKLGVDYVSSGALTHSAPILDLSLKHLRAL